MSENQGSLRSSTDANQGSNIGAPGGGGGSFPGADAANDGDPERDKWAAEVFEKYNDAKEYRKLWDRNWDRYFRYFMGVQDSEVSGWRTKASVNLIRPIVEAIVAHMTDANPTIQVSACEEAFVESSDIMQQVLFRDWQDNKMREKLNNIVRDTMIYGTSYAKVYYDTRTKRMAVDDIDIHKIFPSRGATSFDDALHVLYVDNVEKHVLESRFPDCKGKLIGGLWDEDLMLMKNITSTKPQGDIPGSYVIPGGFPGLVPKVGGKPVNQEKDFVTYIEYWHRDPDDWNTIWVTIAANGVILSREKNPFNHKKFPFAKFIDTGLTNTWYGTGEVHHLERTQDSINNRRSQFIELLKLNANPPFLVPAGCGIGNTDLANVPGIMLTYSGQQPPTWMTPGQIEPAFFQLNEMDQNEMKYISGIYDQTQGQKAKGITSAQGVIAVQEISQTFIRPKIRNMESALICIGEFMLSGAQQYYTKQETIRVAGRRMDKLGKFIKVNVPALNDQNEPVLKNDLSLGKYDVNISVGSEPDFNKAGRYEQMVQLRQILGPQRITDKMLLETVPDMTEEEVDAALMNTAGPGALPGEPGIPPQGAPKAAPGLPPPPPPEVSPTAGALVQQPKPLAAPPSHAAFQADLEKIKSKLNGGA